MAFAKEQGISVTSYMTLGYGKILEDPVIQKIAKQHDATSGANCFSLGCPVWVCRYSFLYRNVAICKAIFDAFKVHLTERDMQQIADLERGERLVNPANLAPEWD